MVAVASRLQEAAGHKNLEVVAISLDRNNRSTVAPFLQQLNIRHLNIYLDPDTRIGGTSGNNANAAFQIYGMPITYIVGPTGRLKGYMSGEADWSSDDDGKQKSSAIFVGLINSMANPLQRTHPVEAALSIS